ncbi:MAG: SulP family inorganic anion transporter [Bdellovibrionales bacterium]|nr:SulP family inorganic anion transporter [Bdellovibrionales bacterium]
MSTNEKSSSSLMSDLSSGFVVFLIALPLCLGIALASGFPPIAGVLTAIIGGLIASFLGSSPLTIKGPAAGLIVIAIGAVQDLGAGDPMLGYKRALAVGVVAAVFQILLSLRGAATLGVAMSPSVVHGMLAAIGVIIFSKQIHVLLGVTPHSKEPLHLLLETPNSILSANPEILLVGGLSLFILLLVPRLPWKAMKRVPAPLLVLMMAIPASYLFDMSHAHQYAFSGKSYSVGPEYLIRLPGSILQAVAFPDFSEIFSLTSFKYIMLFTLIGSIESVLSVLAVDSLDPKKRVSDLNRDLFAVGVGNLLCASIGGLPMISEIVRSKANIDAGAKSKYSNVTHGACLLGFVAILPGVLSMIPLSALAAMLVYTGFRLASPAEFRRAKQIGNDQLVLFLTTFILTITVDILVGVVAGVVLELAIHLWRGASYKRLFRSCVETEVKDSEAILHVVGPAVFTNLLGVRNTLLEMKGKVDHIVLDYRDAELIDHTFQTRISTLAEEFEENEFEITGLDSFVPCGMHPCATRVKSVGAKLEERA